MIAKQFNPAAVPANSQVGIYQWGTSPFVSIGEKIHHKIDRVLNSLAFGNQFNQIEVIRKELPGIATFKKTTLENHIKTLSNFDKFSLAVKLVIERINIIRTIIMRFAIHPATTCHRFENVSSEWHYAQNVPENEERIDIFTDDHQLLDARVIYADKTKDKNKLTVVWFVGSGGYLGMYLKEARDVAKLADINILLNNPRGVGLSLGTEYTLEEAVEDGKAVIKHAFENLCDNDPKRLGLYGLSLGGGITATALNELQEEKVIDQIALYINHQSFPSLQHCVKGLLGIPAIITRLGLAILRINPLNTGSILTKNTLAKKTIVITAGRDQLMKGAGRLESYLRENPPLHTNGIEHILQEYAYHCDPISPEVFKKNNI